MMKTISLILFVCFANWLFSCSGSVTHYKKNTRPNIVFLLADDLGYGELGSYGQKVIKTPVLDKLAEQGLRFTNFYAGSPMCAPSRAVMLTGKHAGTATIRGNIGYYPDYDRFDRVALREDELTLGEMLRDVGYQTSFIGKWHLDDCNVETWAYNRGFDYAVQEQWGSCPGGIQYDERMHWINGKQDSLFYDQQAYDCLDEFRTNIAIDFLDAMDRESPFFLFMSYRAPHAHEKYIREKELYADQGWPEVERRHAAKITLLDREVGRLLEKLKEMGVMENTIVVFTSDNGAHAALGHDHRFFESTGDLRGLKRDTYEGGIRVPAIAYWEGKIAKGTVSDSPFCGQDFMPTFAEIAGIDRPKQTNGVSFAPVLFGDKPESRDYLIWEFHKYGMEESNFRQAIRTGKMKGVRYGVHANMELYNLEEDFSENNDIADIHPELIRKMEHIVEKEHITNVHFPYGGYATIKKME